MGPLFLERKTLFLGGLVIAMSFLVGVLIGYFSNSSGHVDRKLRIVIDRLVADQFQGPPNFVESAMGKVDPKRLRSNLQELTRYGHYSV